jgi:uncharacterized protein YkwD
MSPKTLARSCLVLLTLALAACGSGGGGGGGGFTGEPAPTPPPRSQEEIDLALEVLDLVNQERTSRGLDPLIGHAGADDAAYGHAYDMDARNFFDHINPTGESPGDRLDRHGVSWSGAAENIARGQDTPADVMADWMSSAGHRANILDPSYTHLGVGVHVASGGPWWVQNFFEP